MADITQRILLKTDQYSQSLRKANQELKTTLSDMAKSLVDNSRQFYQNEVQVKQWAGTLADAGKKFSTEFTSNFATGAKAMTLAFGSKVMNQVANDATATAFSFSKAFAEIRSRSNASEKDLMKWRQSIMRISSDTTANMDSMAESFKDMFSSVKDPDELLKIMEAFGAAAAMGDGDVTKVSSSVKSTLQDQGRKVTIANANDVLGSYDVLRRKGDGYKDLDAAKNAMGGIRGADISNSGMSMRQLANIMAASTKTVGNSMGGETVKLLMQGNSDLRTRERLRAGLGLGKTKSGALDISTFGGAAYSKKVMGLGSDDTTRLMNLKEITGASDDVAQAFLNIAKKGDQFDTALKSAASDTKSFAASAAEGKANLVNAYRGMTNTLVTGMTDIFVGFEKPFQDLVSGHFKDAAKGVGHGVKEMGKGMWAHPGLVLGAVGTTAAAGTLLKSLMPKVFGSVGDAASLAKGVGMGAALQQMGVTPVYVVNANDIANGKNKSGVDKIGELLGTGASAAGGAGAPAAMGFLAKYGKLMKWGGIAATVAAEGIETYSDYSDAKDDHGKNVALAKGGAGLAGSGLGMWGGAAAGAAIGSVVPVVGTAAGALIGGAAGALAGQWGGHKIIVEIDSKDAGLFGRPKNTDNVRNAETH